MSNIKPAGYLNKFTGMIWNPEQQPGADSEPEIYEPLVRLSDVHGLVAENSRAVDAVTVFSKVTEEITEIICDEIGHEKVAEILGAFNDLGNMPNTNAFTAELRAQGVDEFASNIGAEAAGLSMSSNAYKAIKSTVFRAVNFAANLRAGRKG
jgi:hypothetical protein